MTPAEAVSVEVVIAVHTLSRPIRRAVESVLAASPTGRSRALVVAHGVDAADIRGALAELDPDRVDVLPFADGIPSPAGPFNHGVASARADFVTVLGSDDSLEAGALDAALARADEDDADTVILPVRSALGAATHTPLVRPFHHGVVDPVRDRLFTRTAPLALVRREIAQHHAPVFDPAFRTGEDIEFGARLWSQTRVAYHRADPGYVVHADQRDRVTDAAIVDLTLAQAAPIALASRAWIGQLRPHVLRSLAAKMLRVHVLGTLGLRLAHAEPLSDAEADAVAQTVDTWLLCVPDAARDLPRSEQDLVDTLRYARDDAQIREAHARARAAATIPRLVPRQPWRLFARDSTLRRYALYAMYAKTTRRPAA